MGICVIAISSVAAQIKNGVAYVTIICLHMKVCSHMEMKHNYIIVM